LLNGVVPVFKNGVKELIQNYRSISLLSIIGKSMERCVFKHLYNYLVENQLIACFQSGFRPGDSTTNQLLHLTNIDLRSRAPTPSGPEALEMSRVDKWSNTCSSVI
jgi:hypothetical protein